MKKGFTLIELMVVIAIISFLSILTVPQLMTFLAKAKRTEAYINLRSLGLAQRAFFAEHGCYTKILLGKEGLGWKPEGSCNYTYGFSDGSEGESHFVGTLKTPSSHLRGSGVSGNRFLLCAAGSIYGDKVDILSIDQDNKITVVQDALQS